LSTNAKESPARTAAEICKHVNLGPKAAPLVRDGLMPRDFLNTLIEHSLYADAIRFMAHSMLPRASVWWACLCVRHTAGDPVPASDQDALGAALRWVLDPSDANRQAAQQAGRKATVRNPAGAAAQAAYWCGAAPAPDKPVQVVSRVKAAKLVGASVLLAGARGPTADISLHYRQFVTIGLDVDVGRLHWKPTEEKKAKHQPTESDLDIR
jgi:hypothetical protein